MLRPSIARLSKQSNWSSSLNLPRSTFPPRALEAARPAYLRQCTDDLYAWQTVARRDQSPFVLHDGPPYANGELHIGHALNKILKDVICRFHISQGRKVSYRPGWDCHGLPIEIKALQAENGDAQSYRTTPPVQLRGLARKLAEATVENQMKTFKEWGVLGEWENPYRTMDTGFEIEQLKVFKGMVENGLIYRDLKPVHWSPSSGTALAEAELEYDDNHVSNSAYIKYKLDDKFAKRYGLGRTPAYALIWTTTPWTLPANRAIAIHRSVAYCILKLHGGAEALLIARARLTDVLARAGKEVSEVEIIIENISGGDLLRNDSLLYMNPFSPDQLQPVLLADFVSDQSGTGLVHIAPGHGFDDYKLCREHSIAAFAPVDDHGCFTSSAFPISPELLQGKDIMADGQSTIIDWLQHRADPGTNLVWAMHRYTHKYPIDWRTKLPVIIRATAQWFAEVDSIKDRALRALQGVTFLPGTGKSRLEGFVLGRSQWCISRQRAWGVPIPALYDADGEAIIDGASVEHIISTIRKRGVDSWWADEAHDQAWVAPHLKKGFYTRGRDTMDVWFDSGTTWTQIPPRHGQPRADVYIEGTDQHRGWFQSSLLTYVAQQVQPKDTSNRSSVQPPFGTLITHGFILDAAGRKMSKSIGNVVSPEQIMSGALLSPSVRRNPSKGNVAQADGMGPDALRLWVATCDYTKDVSVSETTLKAVNSMLHKYRVTFKWLLGALADCASEPIRNYTNSSKHTARYGKQYHGTNHISDRLALAHLSRTVSNVHAAYTAYDFHKAILTVNNYINIELSSFYFETAKDPLYADDVQNRLRVQTTCFRILKHLLRMLGPTLPLLVTEVVDHASPIVRSLLLTPETTMDLSANFPFESHRPASDPPPHALLSQPWGPSNASATEEAETLLRQFQYLFSIGDAIKALQETARKDQKLRSGLESRVVLTSTEATLVPLLQNLLTNETTLELLRGLDSEGRMVTTGVFAVGMLEELAELFVVSGVDIEIVSDSDMALRAENAHGPQSQDEDADEWVYGVVVELPPDAASEAPPNGATTKGKSRVLVEIRAPSGGKCPRCWRWVVEQEKQVEEPDPICGRCKQVLREKDSRRTE